MTPMLETQLTVDDIAEFQRFFGTSRPSGRQTVRSVRLVYVSMMAILGVGAMSLVHKTAMGWFLLAFVAAGAIFTWFMAPRSLVRGARYRALKTNPSGVLPPARLWLDELGLSTDSAGVSTHYAWSTISQIDDTPTHVFVWVSERQAVIIRRRNAEQPVGAFVQALRAALEHNGSPPRPGFGQ
jgi:hypothetical protein